MLSAKLLSETAELVHTENFSVRIILQVEKKPVTVSELEVSSKTQRLSK